MSDINTRKARLIAWAEAEAEKDRRTFPVEALFWRVFDVDRHTGRRISWRESLQQVAFALAREAEAQYSDNADKFIDGIVGADHD